MYSTALYKTDFFYLANPLLWPHYIPFSNWVVTKKWDMDLEFSCSDYFAREINRAIREAEDPDKHTTYDTVEEFLESLRNR